MIARDPSHRAPSVGSPLAFSLLVARDALDEPLRPLCVPLRKEGGLTKQNAPQAPQP